MANTYTWTFPQLDTAPTEGSLTDVVKTIHWRFTATSNSETNAEGEPQHSYTVSGAQSFDADPDNFTAFDDLTAEIVTGWVTSAIGEQGVSELMSHVDAQISERMAPLTVLRTIG